MVTIPRTTRLMIAAGLRRMPEAICQPTVLWRRGAASSGAAGSIGIAATVLLAIADARVEGSVGNIDQDVDDHLHRGIEQRGADDDRIVARGDGDDKIASQ